MGEGGGDGGGEAKKVARKSKSKHRPMIRTCDNFIPLVG